MYGATKLLIDDLPVGPWQGALHPDGAHHRFKGDEDFLYNLQRPGITLSVCISIAWCEPYTDAWPSSWPTHTISKCWNCHD